MQNKYTMFLFKVTTAGKMNEWMNEQQKAPKHTPLL